MRVRDVIAGGMVLLAAACSDGGTPATAPPVPETVTTTTVETSTSSSMTTIAETTTTMDRLAEIEAIFRDLELRRLDALYRQDEEAYRALFANEAFYEEGIRLGIFDLVEFIEEPDPDEIGVRVVEVIAESESCIAVVLDLDLDQALGASPEPGPTTAIERTGSGEWGFSWIGTEWRCTKPHPLDA